MIAVFAILVLLLAFFPFLLNFKKVLGIGSYTINDQKTIEDNNGSAIAEFSMKIEYLEGYVAQEYMKANYFSIAYSIRVRSSGNVENIEMEYLNYTVFYKTERSIFKKEYLNLDGTKSFTNVLIRQLYKGDEVKLKGNVGISFMVDGERKEEVINFELVHYQPVDPEMYEYTYDLPLIWLKFGYFIFLGLIIIALARVIWRIKFNVRYTEEERKKDEYFHGYIRKLAEEKNAENSV